MRGPAPLLLLFLASCGGATETAPPPREERPAEAVCTLGEDPSAHLGVVGARIGAAASVEPGVAPLMLDVTQDGKPDMVFVARTEAGRWLVLLGCQDFSVAVLGAFQMPGHVGTLRLEPFIATRGPAHEIKVTLTARDTTSAQEFWAYFGFDGADLGLEFSRYVSRVPPQGEATRAAVTFEDENGDGTNEIRVVEETLDGDGARQRVANEQAPLPRIQSARTIRFRWDATHRTFTQVE